MGPVSPDAPILVPAVLLLAPPLLCGLVCLRKLARVGARRAWLWLLAAGLCLALVSLVINALFLYLAVRSNRTVALSSSDALFALGLSWTCLWYWIVVAFLVRRRRRPVY